MYTIIWGTNITKITIYVFLFIYIAQLYFYLFTIFFKDRQIIFVKLDNNKLFLEDGKNIVVNLNNATFVKKKR